jgi:hypothetical protein
VSYRVTAPYVTVPVRDDATGAETVHGFYADALLPATVSTEAAERLVAKGMVEKTRDLPPNPTPPTGDQPPAGNASREAWAAYATTKGAPETETASVEDGGLPQRELRAKYGA